MFTRASAKRHTTRIGTVLTAAAVALGGLIASVATPPAGQLAAASAEPCAPVELIFARGRNEQPGIGRIGDALVGSLNARLPQPVGVYAVNYAANNEFARGANDISNRIQYMAGACPNTRLIVGGYSLGAAAAVMALSATQKGFGFGRPLPPGMDAHVAAVVLVGNFSNRMGVDGIGPAYRDRTIDLCNGTDPVCSNSRPASIAELASDWQNHLQDGYINGGFIDRGAEFAAARVR
ncbi:cutinase family protein [Mycolicibacterium diernhoferi]|uniref:Cutinase n=1 Tax=Mycolicibacterium diernhoferi TaxID=1801 RepID=A0A1Q4HEU4_9MYCO|nr:cutinase family protein [Mycolicibacterium diernhoferi]OJZ66038.1 cutinase family protein [Mycolicibacterium diernhoferi]OPE55330.1 cutinase family protein [Mycolicibacterium diernhoferi]PEG54598.1 cutinase family protein [Mycolicibacterium diernhoferi]QYL23946.1 cutinase family protein [Mycolicibacterium diernhoferi]